MLALSQLSYGPETTKCSAELVVLSPVHLETLLVACGCEPERHCYLGHGEPVRNQVATIELGAVRGDRVDLIGLVASVDESVRTPVAASAAHLDYVSAHQCPFALDAQQAVA